jgi:hypothetical protein
MKVEVLNDVVRLIRQSTQTQTFAMQSACCSLNLYVVWRLEFGGAERGGV